VNKDNVSLSHMATWLTIIVSAIMVFAFFETMHGGYVTHDDLEIALLKRDKENLTEEVEHYE
jgi:hypothetical protein